MSEWKLISTAPKDGTVILGFCPDESPQWVAIRFGECDSESWWEYADAVLADIHGEAFPTHWQSLTVPSEEPTP